MQAVILAAGRSTRTYPLTLTRPKPLLMAGGKTILEHNLCQLEGLIDKAILVVGYRDYQIIDFIKKLRKRFKTRIEYIEQREQLGTGHAAACAEKAVSGKFLVMGGDDFFSIRDIRRVVRHRYAVLAQRVKDPSRYGVFIVKNNRVKRVVEKPQTPVSNLANTGLYVFDEKIFGLLKGVKKSKRGEYEITDTVSKLAQLEDVRIERVRDYWIPIGYPWDLLDANALLLEGMKSKIKGRVERGVTIHGRLSLGKGSVISSGTYIEGNVSIGENCKIGPDAYIKGPASIGDGCRIADAEISNAVLFPKVRCGRKAHISDSIVGSGANIGALTHVVNERSDRHNILSEVNGKLLDTGVKRLGTVLADNTSTGMGTVIYPGRKLWPGKKSKQNEIVKEDIK